MGRLQKEFLNFMERRRTGRRIAVLTLGLLVSQAAPVPAFAWQTEITDAVLMVTGSPADEAISLRLSAGDHEVLEVDLGDDGFPDQTAARADFQAIELDGGGGNDDLIIDEINGAFTDSELTTIIGGVGEDLIIGGSGPETLLGGSEADSLYGGPAGDSIRAEAGDDFVDGEGGNDSILGGDGQDMLWGAEDNDTVDGEAGADRLEARYDLPSETTTTNDTLNGGLGIDQLRGGPGDDTLTGGADFDTVNGDEGSDRIREEGALKFRLTNTSLVGVGLDHLFSIEHATLVLSPSGTELNTSAFTGSVTLVGNDLKNTLLAGPGDDRLEAGGGDDLVVSGAGNDFLSGGAGNDELSQPGDVSSVLTDTTVTGLGTDTISGFEAAVLLGGPSANVMDASAFSGRALLYGQAGNDRLVAGASGVLVGDSGDDVLIGGDAHDYLSGGEGNDLLSGNRGNDSLKGERGDDTITGGSGRDYIGGNEGRDRLQGGPGKDQLWAGSEVDTIVGGAGPDFMHGGRANDRIFAKDGSQDTVRGGRGFDRAIVDEEDEVFAVERFGRR